MPFEPPLMDPFVILVVVALLLFVGAIIRPAWPLCAVGGLLLAVALLIGKHLR
jgi:hypothetical protein